MAKIQLVLFDFDGTLVDTAPDLVRATNFYLESQGLDPLPEERIRAEIGMGLRRLIMEVMPQTALTDEARGRIEGEFLAIYQRELLVSPRLFEGALEFLTDWQDRGGLAGIVSNKRMRFITPILEHLGILDYPWVDIVGGDTYPNMKPHPEPFLTTIERAGVSPEETLIVGDGLPDVAGALAIGSPCVVVDHGYHSPEELMNLGAFARIESFHELLPLITGRFPGLPV